MTDFEVIALFTPADGQANAVHAALASLVAPSRAELGNRSYTVRRTSATPPRYAVLETYRDRAAFEAHRAAPYVRAFLARSDELLAEPPDVLAFEPKEVR
jgi:quinol monooxygenase YgiN